MRTLTCPKCSKVQGNGRFCLDFHAGNLQRLLKVIELSMLVPKEYAGSVIRIVQVDNKKLLVDEMIIFANATQGVIK